MTGHKGGDDSHSEPDPRRGRGTGNSDGTDAGVRTERCAWEPRRVRIRAPVFTLRRAWVGRSISGPPRCLGDLHDLWDAWLKIRQDQTGWCARSKNRTISAARGSGSTPGAEWPAPRTVRTWQFGALRFVHGDVPAYQASRHYWLGCQHLVPGDAEPLEGGVELSGFDPVLGCERAGPRATPFEGKDGERSEAGACHAAH
jgi:hypothetical protein